MRRPLQPRATAAASLLLLVAVAGRGAAAARHLHQQAAQSTDTSPAGAAATGTDLPAAAAYFPLLSSDVTSSYPAAAYEGVAHNLDWVEDPAFGQVMACDEARQSYVSIPGLEYGQGGGLAVAFWAKVRPHSGASMDYAYSHTNAANTDYAFDPNTVAVFFPERDHPDFGVARAMLRDATDVRTNGTDPFYLDSSGCVASSAACTPAAAGAANLAAAEGQWHLLGLSTRPGGGKGFQLYVNGTLAAEAKEGVLYPDAEGFTKTATGGGPMNLTGNITLCSRSDLEPTRFFGGSIAHLLIYNTSLTPDQMRLIYETGQPQSQSASPAAAPVPAGADQAAASPGATDASSVDPASAAQQAVAAGFQPAPGCITSCADDNGVPVCLAAGGQVRQCTASNTSTGAPVIGAAEQQQAGAAAVAPDSPPAAAQQPGSDPSQGVAQLGGQPLCSESPIQGVSTVQACAAGYICAPLSRQQIAANFGGQLPLNVGDIGVCAYMPHDLMLPNATDVPPAMAFFPLNSQTLQSFPLPEHTGSASGAGVVGDPLFGSALLCTQSDRDLVALDPVQYARSGAFSINLWFKPENMSGSSLSYLFSHRGTSQNSSAASNTGWGPNQIQMYLPQEEHPAYGVVRAIVKDFDDQPTSMGAQTWLDSDGNVAYNGERSTSPQSPSLFDGDWHMATLTSQPGGGRGYRMYLDGQLAGEVAEGRSYVSPEGFPIPIDGGDPMLLDGNVVLCVRSDDPGGRHYDGQLAHLGLHDTALDETQVGLLYSEVSRNMGAATSSSTITPAGPELPVLSPSSGANITRFSISGQRCQFPALYNGELATDCVTVEGMSFCQIEENVWEECVPLGGEVAAASTGGPMYSSDPSQAPPSSAAEEPSSSDPSAAASPIIIADSGAQCQLPLRYNGMQVDGCVNIDGSYQCWGMETDSWEGCPTDLMETQPEGGELGVPASSVALHVVPSISRQTASGDACQLPVVYQGEILDDCIDRNGTWSCLDSSLSWQQCDLGSSPPPTDDQGQLLVTQRTTTSGEACLLPAVFRGHLFFDCVDYSDAQTGTAEICPTQAATWELCSNSGFTGQEQPDPQPFSAAVALNRTAPGRLGMLCPVVPSDQPAQNCAANYTCAPLPQLSPNVSTSLAGLGFCTEEPAGGTFGSLQYLQLAKAPTPLAYFPLTSGSLESLLLPAYNGSLSGIPLPTWHQDPTFGSVINCTREAQSAVMLDTVPYASNGSFAVSLWMQRLPGSDTSGELFQYLYSHTGLGGQTTGQAPNKVAIYLPDRGHPAYGVVRVIVSDANDTGGRWAEPTFMDSDGTLGNDAGGRKAKHADVNDGGWHMVTVSTHANDTPGFTLFVDGQQVAELSPSTKLNNGSAAAVTGGDPARLADDIVLCARSDLDEDRFFDGSVAHLMLFNEALTPDHVAGLYAAYSQNGTNGTGVPLVTAAEGSPDSSAMAADPSQSSHVGLTSGEIAGIVVASIGAGVAVVTLLALLAAGLRKRRNRFERYEDNAFPGAAFTNAEAGVPLGADRSGPAALPRSSAGHSIQLSSGKSLPVSSMAYEDSAAAGSFSQRRIEPALSDVSSLAPSVAGGHTADDGSDMDTASMATARSRMSDSLSIEPGKRGLIRKGGARVVLPGVQEADPRGPEEP